MQQLRLKAGAFKTTSSLGKLAPQRDQHGKQRRPQKQPQ
jgi:hypothetical protein